MKAFLLTAIFSLSLGLLAAQQQINPEALRYPPQFFLPKDRTKAYGAFIGKNQKGKAIDTPVAVKFHRKQVSPKYIVHPVKGDKTKFQVKKSGVYLVSWSMSLANDKGLEFVSIHLVNGATGYTLRRSDIRPSCMNFTIAPPNILIPVAGQTVVKLKKNMTFQLVLIHQVPKWEVINPQLNIVQIGE